MSGFFSLGGGKDNQDQQTDGNNSLFLFKNEEIYNKGFELWHHQYYQQRAHQGHHQHSVNNNIQYVDFSVGPSRRNAESSSQLIVDDSSSNSFRLLSSGFGTMMMRQGRSSGGESINCQDCGNQAKKDCEHMRCRTCCKSRGFECQTHLKSTWVPATKRRERQQQQLSAVNQQQHVRGEGSGKRLRDDGSSLVACNATSGFELGHFPAEINTAAMFRCVRVSSVDDPQEHLAYQTAVNIAGHVFKGILYDQGPENPCNTIGGGGGGGSGGGESSHHRQRPLDLISGAATHSASTAVPISGGNMNDVFPTTTMVNDPSPSSIYPTPLSAFMAGTQFFPPPRP